MGRDRCLRPLSLLSRVPIGGNRLIRLKSSFRDSRHILGSEHAGVCAELVVRIEL
jgi:hypothetical protein